MLAMLAWLVLSCWCLPGHAGEPTLDQQLSLGERDIGVRIVIDGDTIELADGRRVRLLGIQAPELPESRPDPINWPLGAEARDALIELIGDQTVSLYFDGIKIDRYGRTLAYIVTKSGEWIQEAMLRRGMAMVYTFPDNRTLAHRLYEFEATARRAKLGMWALAQYRPVAAEAGRITEGRGRIVTGLVLASAKRGKWVYLNFGPNYRTDFTVRIHRKAWRMFRDAGIVPEKSYRNRRIEVRGFVFRANGPMMQATHPEQIIILP